MKSKKIKTVRLVLMVGILILAMILPSFSVFAVNTEIAYKSETKAENKTVGFSVENKPVEKSIDINNDEYIYDVEIKGYDIGADVVVSIQVYIEGDGYKSCGFSELEFRNQAGEVIGETLPTKSWEWVTGEFKVLFDATDMKTFIRYRLTNGKGLSVKIRDNDVELSENTLNTALFGNAKVYLMPCVASEQNTSFVILTEGGSVIVYDGGNYGDYKCLLDTVYSIKGEIDYWFISHYHHDHIGAISEILKRESITINNLVYDFLPHDEILLHTEDYPGNAYFVLYQYLQNHFTGDNADSDSGCIKHRIFGLEENQKIKIDEITFTVLNKSTDYGGNFGNNTSVVYKMDTANESMLFLGDAGIELGADLLDSQPELLKNCAVVQMAHHGQNGVGDAFYTTMVSLGSKIFVYCAPSCLYYGRLDANCKYFTTPNIKMKESRQLSRNLKVQRYYHVQSSMTEIR